jgi:hypothetical protein
MNKAFDRSQNSPVKITRFWRITCAKLILEVFIGKIPGRAYQYRPVRQTIPVNIGVPQGNILGPTIPQSSLSKMYVDVNKLSLTFPITAL